MCVWYIGTHKGKAERVSIGAPERSQLRTEHGLDFGKAAAGYSYC